MKLFEMMDEGFGLWDACWWGCDDSLPGGFLGLTGAGEGWFWNPMSVHDLLCSWAAPFAVHFSVQ